MKTLKFIGLMIITILILTPIANRIDRPDAKTQQYIDNYFKNHAIGISGVILKKQDYANDRGIISLKVTETNTRHYDPFKTSEEYFYYYINNDYAELYASRMAFFNIGDSIFIKPSTNVMYVYRASKPIDTGSIFLENYHLYNNWIIEHHVEKL